jgi:hypothetical protein
VRTPKYDGFRKIGETLKCASCGREFAGESEVPFREKQKIRVFDESDATPRVTVFREDEKGRCCRYCRHYVVNPFTQRCAVHRREVEATDACTEFSPRTESTSVEEGPEAPG